MASSHRTNAAASQSGADSSPASARAAVSSPSSGGATRRDGDTAALATSAAVTATASTSTSAVTVALADLPSFIADQADAFSAAISPEAGSAAGADANASPKAAEAVKELQIALDPADLGAMTLKLRLAGGKLSVTISVANPQTLAAIKDDSALIAQRLGSNDQALDDLVIQQLNLASPKPETADAGAFASDSSAQEQPTDAEPQPRRRPNASSRGVSSGRGAFSNLTI